MHVLVLAGAGEGMVGIRTNSSPLSCSCTISLLGSGKMEENKENDLRPPLPQSYAATVARQSTVPSTSTMPGKHRVCPSSGRSKKATWGKVESLPTSKGSTRNTTCAKQTGAAGLSGAHLVHPHLPQKQARHFLLCFSGPLASAPPPRAELHHKQAHQQSGNHIQASQLVRQQLLPGWFPGAETGAVEVRSHYFCGKMATDSPKPVAPYPKEASTKLLQKTGRLSRYIPESKGPHIDVDLILKLVLTFMVGGGKLLPQELAM